MTFENDVKMYGIQTEKTVQSHTSAFENDVKMYGIQTVGAVSDITMCLRMM